MDMEERDYHWIQNGQGIVGEVVFYKSDDDKTHHGEVTLIRLLWKVQADDGFPYLKDAGSMEYLGSYSSREQVYKAFEEKYGHRGFTIEDEFHRQTYLKRQ